jgi:bacterioferritin-associated ferredoxin
VGATVIVCLCHRVTDRDIERAVRDGVRCFDTLQDEIRVAAACGCCHDCAREAFDAACSRTCSPAEPALALA